MSGQKAEIYYYDIGDYLSREEKLKVIDEFGSMEKLPFTRLTPNEHGDWISKRNDRFDTWIPIEADKKFNAETQSFFTTYAIGVSTNRDSWVYNYSKNRLTQNMGKMIDFYNAQTEIYTNYSKNFTGENKPSVDTIVSNDTSKISWTVNLKNDAKRNVKYALNEDVILVGTYRPFGKMNLYFDSGFIERPGLSKKLFPTSQHKNIVICITGIGSSKSITSLVTDKIPTLDYVEKSQCFPLYWYETINPDQSSLFGDDAQIVRHEAISDFILERAQSKYGNKVQKEDIFYYVYGILHSKSYRETFEADLKKMLPRIPLVSDYQKFWDFSKAGQELANLHLNYEKIAAYPDVKVESLKMIRYESPKTMYDIDDGTPMAAEAAKKHASSKADDYEYYAVQQMKFPKKGQKDTIIYNHYHTIKNIPEKAYEYIVNGKSAIEWIMERYAVTTDKKSGITNNPNDWALEHEQPRYIFDLLLSVINVSVQSVDIVNNLPEVDWDKE